MIIRNVLIGFGEIFMHRGEKRGEKAPDPFIMKKTKIARPTVKQVLDKLLRLKKIERIGLGRSTRYRKVG
jgi:hypothetical protein